ncbi:MAG: large conductance mechanosensitive channel protein MscL [Anaerolineae bacterium]|nr:large conductance mechanosensitive channel protein MscL [Anaerolineae bacterium]
MIKEFRAFIMRGNVIDLAVAVIIGAAFTAIVNSIVNDVINPLIGLILGGVDLTNIFVVLRDGIPTGPYQTLADAQTAGALTINVGNFLQAVINFLIIAIIVFFIIKAINTAMTLGRKKKEEVVVVAADPLLVAQQELRESIDKLTSAVEKKL